MKFNEKDEEIYIEFFCKWVAENYGYNLTFVEFFEIYNRYFNNIPIKNIPIKRNTKRKKNDTSNSL